MTIPRNPLVGTDYITPDLLAKVTGRARYAEDFRAEGMLFCKLLLSPRPHARVRRIALGVAARARGSKHDGTRALLLSLLACYSYARLR